MPSHTELERAKRRLDISRPIDSFPSGSLQKQKAKINRKVLNRKANPRPNIITSAPVKPVAPKKPIIAPTQPRPGGGIVGQARTAIELRNEQLRKQLSQR